MDWNKAFIARLGSKVFYVSNDLVCVKERKERYSPPQKKKRVAMVDGKNVVYAWCERSFDVLIFGACGINNIISLPCVGKVYSVDLWHQMLNVDRGCIVIQELCKLLKSSLPYPLHKCMCLIKYST